MASQLTDRLTDLADHTPAGTPPPDLWVRGIRQRRARRVSASALVAVLAVMLGMGVWSWHLSRQEVTPVAPRGAPHLPDRIYPPSPWLHAFAGPPGQLVSLVQTDRKSLFHTRAGLVGVTASSGQYGFLDLPGVLEGAVLSPDGRRIAYWAEGATSGDPNTVSDGKAIGALMVYDVETGAVDRHPIPSVHGLSPEELVWGGDDTLYAGYGRWAGGDGDSMDLRSLSRHSTAIVWTAASGTWSGLALPAGGFVQAQSAPGSPLVLGGDHDAYWVRRPGGGWTPFTWVSTSATVPSISIGRDQTMFAGLSNGVRGGHDSPTSIAAGRFPARGDHPATVSAPLIPRSGQSFDVLGWIDGQHVASLRRNPLGTGPISFRVDSLDIRSGQAQTLMDGLASNYPTIQIATDLLSAPSVHASPPPSPLDLRAAIGWAVGIGVTLVLLTAYVAGGVRENRRIRRGRRA